MYFSKRSPYIYALSLTRLCRELPPGGSLAECQLLDLTRYYGFCESFSRTPTHTSFCILFERVVVAPTPTAFVHLFL